ncbi:sulfurtransferase complex subunit TusB [Candidatus Bipolaricaulota bacterium]|nr:sulfurtransferase complex subunit TusB [Candidatus Bipolaricaulota bacterium]
MALILVKYSKTNPISEDILNIASSGDEVVLFQDGVLHALEGLKIDRLKEKGAKIYAMEEDLKIRGYKEEDCAVPLITYDSFLEVVERNENIIG